MEDFHLSERFNADLNRIGLAKLRCSRVVDDAMRLQSACQFLRVAGTVIAFLRYRAKDSMKQFSARQKRDMITCLRFMIRRPGQCSGTAT